MTQSSAPPLLVAEGLAAVVVRGARKSYVPNQWVIDGLDMTVPEASIYALLGSSGCGKTTLLTCLMGLRHLNEGHIRVLGRVPGDPKAGVPGPRVGYMPQELALTEGFSIGETITYFGRVAGLESSVIESRSSELLKFLDIPAKKSRLISELSGGQRQRVSLAVSLLHSPPLLILDEPTVGVDPILRQNIWDFLVDLTRKSRTTVIITTHYIEEARQADTVGLMRRGRLLDEDHPEAIISRSGCSNLEDVFLDLSVQQEGEEVVNDSGNPGVAMQTRREHQSPPAGSKDMYTEVKPTAFERHSNFKVCLWRAALLFRRNKWVTAYALLMPLACFIMFVYAVGRDPRGLHVAVVNEDAANGSCNRQWPGYPDQCGDAPGLSCRFIHLLTKHHDFVTDPYESESVARKAVEDGSAWGIIHFPANFSQHVTERQIHIQNAEDEDLLGSEVDVRLDMSDMYLGNLVRNALLRTWILFFDDLQQGCKLNPRFGAVPIAEMDPVYGDKKPSFQNFALPGAILCVMFFPAVFYSMANYLEDKLTGVTNRSASAGVTQYEMLWARVTLDCIMNAIVTALVLFFAFVVYRFPNHGSLVTVACLLFVQGLCGLSIGYFVATLCSTHFAASYLGTGIFLATSFISGMFWPMQGMHWLLKIVAPLTPMLPAVESVRTVLYQGSNPYTIAMGLGIVGGWTVLIVLATLCLIHIQNSTREAELYELWFTVSTKLRAKLGRRSDQDSN